MFNLLNSVTLDDLVDIAGVAGFILSFCLAVCGLWSNRISILLQDCELISLKEKPDFCFFLVFLCNKTKAPFSLVDIQIDDGTKHDLVPVQRTVFTYRSLGSEEKLPAGPVVLSREFPVRFDSYAAEVLLFPVSRQHIDMKYLHPGDSVHSQAGPLRKRFRVLRRLCTRQPQPRLVLHTSRGRRAIPMQVRSVRGLDRLQEYAVQKAALEEKLVFPS